MNNLLILGAGGMGHMIQETALQIGYDSVAFLDDAKKGKDIIGKCCDYENFLQSYDTAVAAFGDNNMRLRWTERLMEAGYQVPAIVHPSAVVSPSAVIGRGSFVMHRAVVNTNTVIEHGVLVSSGAVIDHDSYIASGVNIGLGSIVKANCTIAAGVRVEAGDVIFSTRRKIDGVDNRNLEDAIYAFGFGPKCSYVKPFGAGHINETYAVYMPGEEGDELAYVLQRVNSNVFKDPAGVMENIFGVTEYLRGVIRAEGGDPDRETLSYIKTIPDFHNTVSRYHAFEVARKRDLKNRAASCKEEIAFVQKREKDCAVLVRQQEDGTLPLRVTHNDTKLNNILFDSETKKGLCIIDLDTIMPGLAANDFGDSIRFGAATAEEDEKDLSKMHFDIGLYELFAKGYLEETKDVLTEAEIQSLPWGARVITLECGIRFLTDYLQGDTYFKTDYPEHNLVRARTQFKLVEEMEQQFEKMQEIVIQYGGCK